MRHGPLDPASLQRMLYDTLDHSDDIVLVLEQTDADAGDLTIASANDAFCRTSGHSHEDLIGLSFHTLFANDAVRSRWDGAVGTAREHGSSHTELLCSRKYSRTFWFGLHLMLVRDSTQQNFVILGRDITESLQARQQQAAVQGLLAKVFLCVKAPVAIVSESGVMQMTNPALDELLGFPSGGLSGKPSMDRIAPSARPAAMAARQCQIEDGHDYTLTTRLLRADGSELPADITSTVVQHEDLRRFRIVTVLRRPDEQAETVHIAGKIKLIGLDEVKEVLGSRWAAVAARAMATAEHVIRRRCGERDTWSRMADGGFLICFAETTEEEAAFRAAALAREIRTRLVGDGETEETANVSAIAAAVDVPNVPGRTFDMLATAISERLNGRLAQMRSGRAIRCAGPRGPGRQECIGRSVRSPPARVCAR